MIFREPTGWLSRHPRRVLTLLTLVCVASLVFGLYLQHVVGLIPCPMCIVQRYALLLTALIAGLTALGQTKTVHIGGSFLLLAASGFGAFVAARQSWLQWFPPEVATCGRDFFGMIETFPLQRAIPMIFKGGGDCIKVDWTFLGASLANWSFLYFSSVVFLALALIWRQSKRR